MFRRRTMRTRAASVAAVLAAAVSLSACAAKPVEPSRGTVFPVAMAQPSDQGAPGVPPPGGTWVVTEAFPAGAVTDPSSSPRGQMVRLDSAMATDIAGGLCPEPIYRAATLSLAAALGGEAQEGDALAAPASVLEMTCQGTHLATYVLRPQGTLLTRYRHWLLKLERADEPPVPIMPAVVVLPLPAPLAGAPATGDSTVAVTEPVTAAAKPMVKPGQRLVYLASYNSESGAKKGWSVLAARSATLAGLKPETRAVELPGKGHFVRLFAAAPDDVAAKGLCRELGNAIADCDARGR